MWLDLTRMGPGFTDARGAVAGAVQNEPDLEPVVGMALGAERVQEMWQAGGHPAGGLMRLARGGRRRRPVHPYRQTDVSDGVALELLGEAGAGSGIEQYEALGSNETTGDDVIHRLVHL